MKKKISAALSNTDTKSGIVGGQKISSAHFVIKIFMLIKIYYYVFFFSTTPSHFPISSAGQNFRRISNYPTPIFIIVYNYIELSSIPFYC